MEQLLDKFIDNIDDISAGAYIGLMTQLLKENIELKNEIKEYKDKALYDYAIITQLKVDLIMLKDELKKINAKSDN
jgi:uncharacterized protein YdcH (DUF465 family)